MNTRYSDTRRQVVAIALGLVFATAAVTSSSAKPANPAKFLGRHEVAAPCGHYASSDHSPRRRCFPRNSRYGDERVFECFIDE
jgi:hypothetical protein